MQITLLNLVTQNVGSTQQNAPAQGDGNSMPFALWFVLNITAFTGTSIAVQLQFQDPATGLWINYGAAFTAVTANGTYLYVVGSTGIGAAAGGVTGTLNLPAPPVWRVALVPVAVTNISATLSATSLPLNN